MGNTRQDALVAGLEALFTAYPPDDTYGVQAYGGSPVYYRSTALAIARALLPPTFDPNNAYGVPIPEAIPNLPGVFNMASGTGVPDDVLRALITLITLIYPDYNLGR